MPAEHANDRPGRSGQVDAASLRAKHTPITLMTFLPLGADAGANADGGLGFMRCDPFLAKLHGDPRWDAHSSASSIFFRPSRCAAMDEIKAFIVVIILCFPIALVLSWAFEITAEGIKLESEIALTNRSRGAAGVTFTKSRGSAFASDNQGWPDKMGCSKMIALLSILAYASNPHPTAEYCHRSQATR